MSTGLLVIFGVGVGLRVWLADTPVAEWLADRNEVVTPLTSWKRVTEGLALHKSGVSPYSGDIFHEMPLMLRFLNYFNGIWRTRLYILFVLTDVITAVILERIAKHHARYLLQQQQSNVRSYSVDAMKLLLKGGDLSFIRLHVIIVYLLNPYSIGSCLAKSTAVFNNLVIAASILATLKGRRVWACFYIALASYLSMYPLMLIIPAAIFFGNADIKNIPSKHKRSVEIRSWMKTVVWLVAWMVVLLYMSFLLEGSWKFLNSTYGFILTVPDFTPNIGVFWYFFAEMFEHFRLFFVCIFQINAFIYAVPLAIRFKKHPVFLMYSLVALIAVFKSYPSYADAALYIGLLPLWGHVFQYMRNNFVVVVMFCVCTVLSPILYYLWIFAGSANANFYFAITLVYCTAQIFLITDLMYAFLRREFDLYNGVTRKEFNGVPWPVILE